MSPYQITDTYSLISICESIKPEASYLTDVFFNEQLPVSYTSFVSVEYSKQGRVLAPYISKDARAMNVNRAGSVVKSYKAPMVGVRRTIGLADIEHRLIGEMPVFSTVTPQERADRLQARDLTELLRMIRNRMNAQAADILQEGKTTIRGYADDGITTEVDEIAFDWTGAITPTVHWDNANATIYSDLKNASETIQENAGIIPNIAICGKGVEANLMKNKEIKDWLMIPNRQNMQLMNLAPYYTSPQCRFIGFISALNLELYSYVETYLDDAGQVKPFVADNNVIVGVPNLGKQMFGAVSYLDSSGSWNTAASPFVPVYNFSTEAQVSSLSVFSRFLLVPNDVDSWVCIKTCG